MNTGQRLTLGVAFIGSACAVGVPYWHIPYAQLSLPDAVWGPPLVLVAGMAALARVLSASRFWQTISIVGASVPAAVLARVLYDTASDPSSHNLWPFELLLAAGPGLGVAAVGALAGGLLSSARGR